MWTVVNRSLNAVFDLWLWPFESLAPIWQVCALALPVAGCALLVFRLASDQDAIEAAKEKIKAHLLEMWLFKDDVGVMLRAQGKILRYTLTYMRHALVAMAVMLLPVTAVIIQAESRYAFRSIRPGESALLKVVVDGDVPVSQLDASLSLPEGLTQETPALRIDESREILWRIRGDESGEYRISVHIGRAELTKLAVVGAGRAGGSPAVYRASDARTLMYPVEPALADDAVASAVHLAYPRSRAAFAGLSSASWTLFAASLVFGFALRGLVGVTF